MVMYLLVAVCVWCAIHSILSQYILWQSQTLLGLLLSITLYSVASDVGFLLYRARLGLHDNLSQDACINDSGYNACPDPPLACMSLTLRPQLEELLWSMFVAIASLSNYCGLRSLLRLICPCMSPTSIAVFYASECCYLRLQSLLHMSFYYTVGNDTGLHVIRFAISSVMMAPWLSCFNVLLHQHFVLHVSTTVTLAMS